MAIIIDRDDETRRESVPSLLLLNTTTTSNKTSQTSLPSACPSRRSMQPLDNLAHYATTLPS